MKYRTVIGCAIAVALVSPAVRAQDAVAPASGQKTLAATMNVYVFPQKGQTADLQSTDESACYGWAVQNTGTDPFQLQKQAEAQQQQAEQATAAAGAVGTGAGARGAVRGAAAGALMSAASKTRVIPAVERGCAEGSVIDRGRESMGVGGWAGVC